jgi:myb proto-oncogene protein
MNQKNILRGVWRKDEQDKLLAAIREQVGEGYQLRVDVLRDPSSSATTEAPEDDEGKEDPRPLLRLGGPELANLDWMKIAERVKTRNHVQCRTRFYLSRHNGNRGRWTLEEVERLKEAHQEYGNQWRAIAAHVGTRSPEQVRGSYKTFLKETH